AKFTAATTSLIERIHEDGRVAEKWGFLLAGLFFFLGGGGGGICMPDNIPIHINLETTGNYEILEENIVKDGVYSAIESLIAQDNRLLGTLSLN
ncbi:hypothetical protein ACJX0J_028384, partial [Zea mays]